MKTSSESMLLLTAIKSDLGPPDAWPQYPGGWAGEIEAALLDSIYSASAVYGSPSTGVRGVLGRYREVRGTDKIDDLQELTKLTLSSGGAVGFAEALNNRQLVPGRFSPKPTKAQAVIWIAERYVSAGICSSSDVLRSVAAGDEAVLKRLFTRDKGVGFVSFRYFLMLLGIPGVKADRMVIRFVSTGIGRKVDANTAESLVTEAAGSLDVSAEILDFAIWDFQRRSARSA